MHIFSEMLFSRLNFSGELMSCGHGMTLSNYIGHEMFIHVHFMLISSKEEGMIAFTHTLHCRLN